MVGLYADNEALQIAITIILSVLLLTDLIGNSLVILIIMTNRSMKSPMNYLLVNLAVADIIVGTFFAVQHFFEEFFTYPDLLAGTMMCKLLTGGSFAWLGAVGSCMSLVASCFERYFAVMHPYSMRLKLTLKKVKKIIIATWMLALVLNAPVFVNLEYGESRGRCEEKWPPQWTWPPKVYSTAWLLVCGVIPTTIIFVLYSRVIYSLWFKQDQVPGTQLAVLKSRKKVTKMVVIISVIYAVCWLPTCTTYFLYHHGIIHSYTQFLGTLVLIMLNSAINPFVYGLQSQRFRRHMKIIIFCKMRRQTPNQGFSLNESTMKERGAHLVRMRPSQLEIHGSIPLRIPTSTSL